MAKEIVTWCDPCLDENQHNPARAHELNIDGQMREVDFCVDCEHVYLKPLLTLMEKHGQPLTTAARTEPRPGTAKGVRVSCLYCSRTSADDSGMRRHLHDGHGILVGELVRGTCPICGEGDIKRLGRHVLNQHAPLTTWTSAYEWARDNGDPHGRYAEAMKLAAR